MKPVHVIAAILVFAAIVVALAGETKTAFGLLALSTLIELVWSMIAGRGKNL
ncbi:hypothetical protein SNE35_01950 [Paucibacter sp. R3-3]|uniref:Phosphatidate cytidylyltransferase n=1 Tax=Roseateles agri TaxID=3098619 RepID=A0ABU5DDJ8_9BURK|nr:hypothetical protein [Paucibacter sp. R3-3]MDY0743247.1 hypothetical protein [Paucibacter sp. R3-3]